MQQLCDLVRAAENQAGGTAKLADALHVKVPDVCAWKSGKRPLSPETVAALAQVLGLPCEEAARLALLAVVTNPKNAARETLLRKAFGLPKRMLSASRNGTATLWKAGCALARKATGRPATRRPPA